MIEAICQATTRHISGGAYYFLPELDIPYLYHCLTTSDKCFVFRVITASRSTAAMVPVLLLGYD